MGLEPTTLGTTNRCSNQLSYNHHLIGFANVRVRFEFANTLNSFYRSNSNLFPEPTLFISPLENTLLPETIVFVTLDLN